VIDDYGAKYCFSMVIPESQTVPRSAGQRQRIILRQASEADLPGLGLTRRWFCPAASRPISLFFSENTLRRFQNNSADLAMLLREMLSQGHFSGYKKYVREDGSILAVVKVDDRRIPGADCLCILSANEPAGQRSIETAHVPAYPFGLTTYLHAMERYEEAQKELSRLSAENTNFVVVGGCGEIKREHGLLRLFDRGLPAEHREQTSSAFYPSEPRDVFYIFADLYQRGLIGRRSRGIDLGFGLGLVPLIGSIFTDCFEGDEKRKELADIANAFLAAQIPGTGKRLYRHGNYLSRDLSEYDVLYIFGYYDDCAGQLRNKLKNIRPGTLLIECRAANENRGIFDLGPRTRLIGRLSRINSFYVSQVV
jgi:hypothetical protein